MKVENVKVNYSWPFSLILFLAFFFAKIFDKIDWSWWWIFSPLWIPLAIIGIVLLIMGIAYLAVLILDKFF